MQSLLHSARRILERHPAPALPFAELHRLLSEERAGPPPRPSFLLELMRARPGDFRILDPWRGPWQPVARSSFGGRERPYHRRLREAGAAMDVWVLAAGRRDGPDVGEVSPTVRRLRESLHWLGRRVDADSPRALARWLGLVGREDRLRARLAPSVAVRSG